MDSLTSWVLGAMAAWVVMLMLLPRHLPRRFPEDDEGIGATGGPTVLNRSVLNRSVLNRSVLNRSAPVVRDAGPRPARRWRRPPSAAPLPDLAACCDLLAVAAASGSTVGGSIVAVGSVGRGPVAEALGRAAGRIRNGEVLTIAIESLRSDLGAAGQPLITTLTAAASSGLAPGPALARLADAERRRSRRRTEARVRRLPVLLLLPIVGLILPAFVLLTLVPVGLSAARGADLAVPVASASPPKVAAVSVALDQPSAANSPCPLPLHTVASQEDPHVPNCPV